MAFVRFAGPFFGISVKAPPALQVEDDKAVVSQPGERRIPFRGMGGLPGDARPAKGPVQDVGVRQKGEADSQCDSDENEQKRFPFVDGF